MTDNLLLRGQPDHALLNRHQPWEVRDFTHKFAMTHGGGRAAVAEKAKRLLQYVPEHLRSHAHVEAWLLQNWDLYL